MKKISALLLPLGLLLGLWGCANTEPVETTAPKPSYQYPQIQNKLTWDAVNAFAIKSETMTVDEMRDLCIDFFAFTKTALWIPNQTWSFTKTADGKTDEMTMGKIYGGLPYINSSSGNVYRLLDKIDEQTGVVDMTEAIKNPHLFGSQCSIGSYWAWGRVINSAEFGGTYNMVQARGFLRVGPYTYDDSLMRYQDGVYDTSHIAAENGSEVMNRSYAQMKRGDGLVNYTTSGHVMMCSTDPVVVYNADGTVDGNQSYVHIIDQFSQWDEMTNDAGDTFTYKGYLNRKMTFNELMLKSYLPFTFAEFLGTDPVENTECTFSHQKETATVLELAAGSVTANYGISDVHVLLKDAEGTEVARATGRTERAGTMELHLAGKIPSEWAEYADGSYTVEVVCQLSTGERPTIYTGKLVR